ncbi:hypothetical protein M7I_7751 [Glarea lozoyensis 74030]|uniref:Uncharacterized protein n=1 Tax=Glarea lozoyensis (strain ATCC 74030 / MF5533) TaxID=1104152 RepID=H0EY54_GLAL7|nr:hypothetical protein M7I_7751 [Glarea lozoyensis 74030]
MTFTSPSVYIVAPDAYAWYKTSGHGLISYGRMCGHSETSATYTIAQESISTIPTFVELGGRPRVDDEDDEDEDEDEDEDDDDKRKPKITAPAKVIAASTSTMGTFDPEATTKQFNVKHMEFVEEGHRE